MTSGHRTYRRHFALLLIVMIAQFFVSAQLRAGNEGHNIAGISMARAFVASARGLEAIGTNPANLTLPYKGSAFEYKLERLTRDSLVEKSDSAGHTTYDVIQVKYDTLILTRETPPTVSFTLLPSFSFDFRTDFINYDIYNQYFTGVDDGTGNFVSRHLTDDDKNSILGLFPSGLAETHSNFDLRIFGLTIHNDFLGDIGLSITDHAAFNLDIPKDYLSIWLFGLDTLGSSYDLSGTNIRAWYLREYALTYARNLPMVKFVKDFSAGFSFKIVHGYAVVMTDKYNATFGSHIGPNSIPTLDGNIDFRILRSQSDNFPQFHNSVGTVDQQQQSSMSPFPTPAGTGFGVDLGVAGEIFNGIRAAISITDIGSINWTANTMQTVGSKTFHMTNPTGGSQSDTLKDALNGKDTTADAFSMPLPTSMRIGAAIHVDELFWWPGHMLVSIEYQQGFNTSPGNTTHPRLAVGAEWRLIPFLPLRSGVSFGGADRFNWAAGFGLDFGGFAWNFGTENIALVATPHSYQQLSFGMSMMVRI